MGCVVGIMQQIHIFVVSLLMRPTTLYLVPSKITTVDDFTALVLLRPPNYRFNCLLYWFASWVFFEVVNVLSCSPFMFVWVSGRMKAKQRWFKVTRELHHEWFHHVRHHVHDGHWTGEFATVIRRLHCFTVSFRGDVRGESGPKEHAPVNWRIPQWARGQFKRTIIPDWFNKWRDMKFWYM